MHDYTMFTREHIRHLWYTMAMNMIEALVVLLGFQLGGEIIVRWLAIPFPGPVMGMLLLFSTLLVRGSLPEALKHTAQGLLQHLSLLFIPAAVGVMVHGSLMRAHWLPILASLSVGTLLTIAVTAIIPELLLRRSAGGFSPRPPTTPQHPPHGETP